MYKTISMRGSTLAVISDKYYKIDFETDVDEIIDYGDVIVVYTNYVSAIGNKESVYGVTNGNIIWQIEDYRSMCPLFDKYAIIAIRGNDDQTFIAIDDYGNRYIYDVQTGKIIRYLDWVK